MAKRANFKTIIAKQKKAIAKEIEQELRDTGMELKTSHDKVVREWTHRPSFKATYSTHAAIQSVKISPQGRHKDLWTWVDKGTKPHVIRAKNAPFLKFQTGYSARTAPIAKSAQGTGQRFGSWVQKTEVQHPGTEARDFSKTFMKELTPSFGDRIQAAIKRGIKKANR